MLKQIIGAASLIVLVAFLAAGSLVQWNPNVIDQASWHGDPVPPCFVNAAACGGHILGSDDVGRDMVSRLLFGVRVSLGNSLPALFLEAVLSIALGLLARYGGPYVRYIVARFADALSCFPPWPILIVISALTQVGQVMNLRSIEIAAGVLLAPKLIRLVAASPAPSNWPRLVLDRLARDWKNLILLLATVDFLGRGVQPPTPTLGHMTSSALNYIFFGWWIALFPCLTFFVIILAIELARRAYLSPGKRLSS